jgi:hypothetical protein
VGDIFLFRLQVGILFGDIGDAGAWLLWIQVVVTTDFTDFFALYYS